MPRNKRIRLLFPSKITGDRNGIHSDPTYAICAHVLYWLWLAFKTWIRNDPDRTASDYWTGKNRFYCLLQGNWPEEVDIPCFFNYYHLLLINTNTTAYFLLSITIKKIKYTLCANLCTRIHALRFSFNVGQENCFKPSLLVSN